MIKVMIRTIIIAVLFALANNLTAQIDSVSAEPSPKGIYLFVSGEALHPEQPTQEGVVEARVLRTIEDENDFEEIGMLKRADNYEDFVDIVGENFISEIRQTTDFQKPDSLWNYLSSNRILREYGFLNYNLDFLIAMGGTYLDKEVKQNNFYRYRVEYLDSDGNVVKSETSEAVSPGEKPDISKPQLVSIDEQDTTITVKWKGDFKPNSQAFFGRVYKKADGQDRFRAVDELIFAANSDTGVVYKFSDNDLEPEKAFQYYVEPLNFVRQPGPASDTVTAYSIDFANLPLMGQVSAKDTGGGIFLSWEKIPQKPYLTGIQIQRSRHSDSGYVGLDTVDIGKTTYLDDRLVAYVTYHYSFKILSIRENDAPPSAYTSAAYKNKSAPPDAPRDLTAEQDGENIRLNWEKSASPNIYAYYVYRGISSADSLEVVSPALRDTTTFLDTTDFLDGRTNYTYGVKAVNYNKLRSDFSSFVTIRPNRKVIPSVPFGISGYVDGSRIRLNWKDMQSFDNAVTGYNLYRRTSSKIGEFRNKPPASKTADTLGFTKVNTNPIQKTYYDDNQINRGENYQYAISTVDEFGVESELSQISEFTIRELPLDAPSRVSGRTVESGEFYFYSVSTISSGRESERSEETGVKAE